MEFKGNYAPQNICLEITERFIFSIIGPARSGKTTFLQTLTHTNEKEDGAGIEGCVRIDECDIYDSGYDGVTHRRKVGMVFALLVARPMSFYDNLEYGPRVAGLRERGRLHHRELQLRKHP